MNNLSETREHSIWLRFHCLFAFLIVPYFLLGYLSEGLFGVFHSYYRNLIPSLVVLYFVFRKFTDGPEVKLYSLFCIWLIISRILCGDASLSRDGKILFDSFVCLALLPTGILLPQKERAKFLDSLSIIFCLFFTFVACAVIYSALLDVDLKLPLSNKEFVIFPDRALVFGLNPNTIGNWFFISSFLMVILFFRHRNPILRSVTAIAFAANYVALGLSFSRNSMIGYSLCMAMLVILIALKYIKPKRVLALSALVLSVTIVVSPIVYSGFSVTSKFIGNVSHKIAASESHSKHETLASTPDVKYNFVPLTSSSAVIAINPESKANNDLPYNDVSDFADSRGVFEDSGRLPIYKTIIDTFRQEPIRLLRGTLTSEIMSISNLLTERPYAHFHNSYLQAFVLSGIPGLALLIAFFYSLIKRMFLLFFSTNPKASFDAKVLVVLLAGCILYNMLESSLFYTLDIRSIMFYIIAGMVIAYSDEIKNEI